MSAHFACNIVAGTEPILACSGHDVAAPHKNGQRAVSKLAVFCDTSQLQDKPLRNNAFFCHIFVFSILTDP